MRPSAGCRRLVGRASRGLRPPGARSPHRPSRPGPTRSSTSPPRRAHPPWSREVLNAGIRTGVPVSCPALVAQAAPEYRPFVTATCDAIIESDDPFTTVTTTFPALCAGDPPIGPASSRSSPRCSPPPVRSSSPCPTLSA